MTSSVPMPSSSSKTPSSSSKPSSSPPELTSLIRVASLPLIAWTIQQVSGTLEQNRFTSSPYATAKGLSTSAYKYTEPLQLRFAPAINVVDGYANKACDVVESRFPSIKTQPEEVASYVHQRRQSTVDFIEHTRAEANKTLDERVKAPAFTIVCHVDKRLTPIVDYLENTASTRLHTSTAPADTQYQYERVYILSKNVTGQLYEYSNQNVLVQRAIQTGDSITTLASSANSHITALASSANSQIHTLISQLQQVQTSVTDTTATAYHELGECIGAMRDIVNTPNSTLTLNEKVLRMADEINFRMRPLLNRMPGARTSTPATSNGNANGNVNGHAQ
ncbi:hypothetical protein B0H12DRAFT_1059175 [Mycena haematopus]|nr:hypothetical protein B0H12DRAFT_1059175 [Mycena haematopus]